MLRRTPSLSEQAKDHIKQSIRNDEFPEGRIPSETELADMLGVSRTTIRDALRRLELEGVITRRQGSGTYVNQPGLQIRTRLEEMWSYETVLRAHGYTPSTEILSATTAPATAEAAAELGLSPGALLLIVRKLFREDERPVILTENQIPAALLAHDVSPADLRQPVYAFLWDHCHQELGYYLSDIVPIVADPALAATLAVRAGTPLISFSEIGYNEDNEPILKAYSYFRDDLLRLRLIRRQG